MRGINLKRYTIWTATTALALVPVIGLSSPVFAEDCLRAAPGVTFATPDYVASYPGETRTYAIDVTNNDSADCTTTNFRFETNAPYDFAVSTAPGGTGVTLAPQQTVRVDITATPSEYVVPSTYALDLVINQHYNDVIADDVITSTQMTYAVMREKPATDTVSPIVHITKPANGATLKRGQQVTIQALASDNVGVTQMVYSTNNGQTTICSGDGNLINCSWTPSQRGSYTLVVVARDAAGNSGTASVTVTVH